MKPRRLLLIVGLPFFPASAFLIGCTERACKTLDMTKGLGEDYNKFARLLEEDVIEKATVCQVGDFTVISPLPLMSDHSVGILVADKDRPLLAYNKATLSIFTGDSTFVTLGDTDKDGKYNYIHYDVRDEESGTTTVVMDNNFDGQADYRRLHGGKGENAWKIFLDGSWHEQVTRDGKAGVIIDGAFRRIRGERGMPVFADDQPEPGS